MTLKLSVFQYLAPLQVPYNILTKTPTAPYLNLTPYDRTGNVTDKRFNGRVYEKTGKRLTDERLEGKHLLRDGQTSKGATDQWGNHLITVVTIGLQLLL